MTMADALFFLFFENGKDITIVPLSINYHSKLGYKVKSLWTPLNWQVLLAGTSGQRNSTDSCNYHFKCSFETLNINWCRPGLDISLLIKAMLFATICKI